MFLPTSHEVLTLKTALTGVLAATNTRKQSTITFEVFVVWLRNQHYYICDVIGIKWRIGIYPTMKVSAQNIPWI